MKFIKQTLYLVPVLFFTSIFMSAAVEAGQNSQFKYEEADGKITITGYIGKGYRGEKNIKVSVPEKIDGKPVVAIGDNAFVECYGLIAVTLPKTITSIGNGSFTACFHLKAITIPESVTSIGNGTFSYCEELKSFRIPKNVTKLGTKVFDGCKNLEKIEVAPESTSFIIIDGILFTMDKNVLIKCPEKKKIGSYVIPDGAIYIDDGAFSRTGLTEVVIPGTVTTIGDSAFAGCDQLKKITIPESVTFIADWAFNGCSSLTDIIIPRNITSIGKCTFNGCAALTAIKIPEGVTLIDDSAFANCKELKNVTIPDSVTMIGNSAFNGCIFLKISANKNSYAEKYAKQNRITFIPLN